MSTISTSLTPEQRALRARIAANTRWSKSDRKVGTVNARAAFLSRFERQVDPEGRLAPDERGRRARAALTAHMQALALRSSRNRAEARQTLPSLADGQHSRLADLPSERAA